MLLGSECTGRYFIWLEFLNLLVTLWFKEIFFLCRCGPTRAMASSFTRFPDHTQRRTTVGRTPLDEWSARRRDLYLTTHNRQTSMPPVGFEPTISASERPQTYALDRAFRLLIAQYLIQRIAHAVAKNTLSYSCYVFRHPKSYHQEGIYKII